MILNDAVVNQGDGSVAADVRMRVGLGGRSVGGPASVADAEAPGQRQARQQPGQALVSLASWADSTVTVRLQVDWKALGIDSTRATITSRASIQASLTMLPRALVQRATFPLK